MNTIGIKRSRFKYLVWYTHRAAFVTYDNLPDYDICRDFDFSNLKIYFNGSKMILNYDYKVNKNVITFDISPMYWKVYKWPHWLRKLFPFLNQFYIDHDLLMLEFNGFEVKV